MLESMRWYLCWLVGVTCAMLPAAALAAEPAPSYYLIGNSLTWDTVPSLLEGDVQWHVDCGKSLPYIQEHPAMPCVKSSTLWPAALKAKQYDFVSVQPHYGSTIKDDLRVIGHWLKLQPEAVFVIHSGWAHHARRAEEYGSKDIEGPMVHSPAYFAALLAELQRTHPQREFRQTHAIELLATIAEDVEDGTAPVKAVSELHRDKIHMQHGSGRYLMHNAMRRAMGQPRSVKGFPQLTPPMKKYLDSVLDTLQRD